jgi:flavodoxin
MKHRWAFTWLFIAFFGLVSYASKAQNMKSFLHQYDLSGKTVIPFNTNAGYGVGSSFETVKEMCPDSDIMKGFSTKGGIERDGILFVIEGEKAEEAEKKVTKWLREIKMVQ